MKKSKYFDAIIDAVCKECEVQREMLISSNRLQSLVDARILAVQAMRRVGMTNEDIALCFHRERTGDMNSWLDVSDLKSRARGIQKSFVAYTQRCDEDRKVFIGHARVIMWYIHQKFGITYYGQPPAQEDELDV